MRPTLLFVVHAWGGGTIRYARELAEHIAPRANVVFAWGVENRSFHISTLNPEESEQTFDLTNDLDAPVAALKALDVSRIDILCTIGLQSYIDELLDRLALPFDVTHLGYELIAICEQLGEDQRYIGDEALLSMAARVQLSGKLPKYLHNAERRITCSRDAAHRMSRLLPGRPVIAARVPEPVDPHAIEPRITPISPGEALRVLILGRLAPHKGVATIAELVRIADSRNFPIAITCLGEPQVVLPDVMTTSPRVQVLGAYNQSELTNIIQGLLRPHIAWLPFVVPETHSYSLSDVMRLRLPLLATGIGAIPERVDQRPATWLLDASEATAESFFTQMEQLRKDSLASPARWLPVDHLPPIAAGFYDHEYLF